MSPPVLLKLTIPQRLYPLEAVCVERGVQTPRTTLQEEARLWKNLQETSPERTFVALNDLQHFYGQLSLVRYGSVRGHRVTTKLVKDYLAYVLSHRLAGRFIESGSEGPQLLIPGRVQSPQDYALPLSLNLAKSSASTAPVIRIFQTPEAHYFRIEDLTFIQGFVILELLAREKEAPKKPAPLPLLEGGAHLYLPQGNQHKIFMFYLLGATHILAKISGKTPIPVQLKRYRVDEVEVFRHEDLAHLPVEGLADYGTALLTTQPSKRSDT
ncbi:MAG: hypothetical protein HY073_05440 [Deltaproteobacteria bacterium]|nr:hypothetical protein [Deltaproteobacteria bacterium]